MGANAQYTSQDSTAPSGPLGLMAKPVLWLVGPTMPSLWYMARLLLGLGVIALGTGVLWGAISAAWILKFGTRMFGHHVTLEFESDLVWQAAIESALSGLMFAVPGVLLLIGSAAVAYLAARNDREVQHEISDGAAGERPEPPLKPVKGIAPKMDLGNYEEHKNDDPK